MTDSAIKTKILAIINDSGKTNDEKISQLQRMHSDARAEQRAVTEGGMVDKNGDDANLREIELALRELGVDPDSPEHKGAATL